MDDFAGLVMVQIIPSLCSSTNLVPTPIMYIGYLAHAKDDQLLASPHAITSYARPIPSGPASQKRRKLQPAPAGLFCTPHSLGISVPFNGSYRL